MYSSFLSLTILLFYTLITKSPMFIDELISSFKDLESTNNDFYVEFAFAKLLKTSAMQEVQSLDQAYILVRSMVDCHAPIHNANLKVMESGPVTPGIWMKIESAKRFNKNSCTRNLASCQNLNYKKMSFPKSCF